MKSRNPKIQRNLLDRSFGGARGLMICQDEPTSFGAKSGPRRSP